jgi:biotin transport system substrate-specific component
MTKKPVMIQAVLSALFAALISAGAFIQIPMPSGVPVVIQDMTALLSGMLLGPLWGSISVILFLLLGIIGLPVFSGKAGLQVLISGPTGGFLLGYFAAALLCGFAVRFFIKKYKGPSYWVVLSLAALAGTVLLFVCGIAGFMQLTDSSLVKTISLVLIPFIPGNIIKMFVMVLLAGKFIPVIKNYLG